MHKAKQDFSRWYLPFKMPRFIPSMKQIDMKTAVWVKGNIWWSQTPLLRPFFLKRLISYIKVVMGCFWHGTRKRSCLLKWAWVSKWEQVWAELAFTPGSQLRATEQRRFSCNIILWDTLPDFFERKRHRETQLSILLHMSLKKKKWIFSTKRTAECIGLASLRKALFIKKNNPFLLYCRIPSSHSFLSCPLYKHSHGITTLKIMKCFIEVRMIISPGQIAVGGYWVSEWDKQIPFQSRRDTGFWGSLQCGLSAAR